MIFTADPTNPLGRRTGSLAGSGTHDDHTAIDGAGAHEIDAGEDAVAGSAQETGAGATELTAWISARELGR